jgi:uroporphyrinogen decarboxylase
VPLIGFGGAPFTLAAYAIEGGPSTTYSRTKTFMYSEPRAWHRLCERFAGMIADYMTAQIEAGVQAVQIFDSWAGALSRADYREFALPHTRRIFAALAGSGVPLIHFGVGTSAILRDLAEAGGDVIGVDWRKPLDEAWAEVGDDRGVQGNLDPALLLGPRDRIFSAAGDVLSRAAGRPGHIFNLGHGVLPTTPLERVQELAQFVHRASSRGVAMPA